MFLWYSEYTIQGETKMTKKCNYCKREAIGYCDSCGCWVCEIHGTEVKGFFSKKLYCCECE